MKCVGLSRNISDQMAALEKMQASERILKRSQRAARLGSFTVNVETGISRLSTEMIALIGMDDAIVQPNLAVFEKMIEPADREKFREAIDLREATAQNSPAFEIAYKTLVEGELNYFEVKIEADRNIAGPGRADLRHLPMHHRAQDCWSASSCRPRRWKPSAS